MHSHIKREETHKKTSYFREKRSNSLARYDTTNSMPNRELLTKEHRVKGNRWEEDLNFIVIGRVLKEWLIDCYNERGPMNYLWCRRTPATPSSPLHEYHKQSNTKWIQTQLLEKKSSISNNSLDIKLTRKVRWCGLQNDEIRHQ